MHEKQFGTVLAGWGRTRRTYFSHECSADCCRVFPRYVQCLLSTCLNLSEPYLAALGNGIPCKRLYGLFGTAVVTAAVARRSPQAAGNGWLAPVQKGLGICFVLVKPCPEPCPEPKSNSFYLVLPEYGRRFGTRFWTRL